MFEYCKNYGLNFIPVENISGCVNSKITWKNKLLD